MTASEVVQKMVEAWNAGDRAGFIGFASPDISQDEGQSSARGGKDAWAADYDILHEAFPDVRLEITSGVSEGDRFACEIKATGTHTGSLRFPEGPVSEVAPTGKTVRLVIAAFYRVEGDLIVSENVYGWMGPMLEQLGVVPGVETTTA